MHEIRTFSFLKAVQKRLTSVTLSVILIWSLDTEEKVIVIMKKASSSVAFRCHILYHEYYKGTEEGRPSF